MERWSALLPDRHSHSHSHTVPAPTAPTYLRTSRGLVPLRLPPPPSRTSLVGRLPPEAWIAVMHFLPVPDLPQLAQVNSKLARLVRDDRVWKPKLAWLDYTGPGAILDWRQQPPPPADSTKPKPKPTPTPTYRDDPAVVPPTDPADDDFGDFLDLGGGGGGATDRPDLAPPQQHAAHDEDGFGAFQDGDDEFSDVLFGDTAGPPSKHKPTRTQGAVDDLLLLFDDDDDHGHDGHMHSPAGKVTDAAANDYDARGGERRPRPRSPRPPPAGGGGPLSAASPPLGTDPDSTRRQPPSSSSSAAAEAAAAAAAGENRLLRVYQRHVSLLLPFYTSLQTQSTSSLVFTTPAMTPLVRARLLASLDRFCDPLVAPTRSRTQRLTVRRNVQSAIDFFESTLLTEFERADSVTTTTAATATTARDEATMRDKAKVVGELPNSGSTLAQVFVQKRETLFTSLTTTGGGSHDPLKNLTKIQTPSGSSADGIDFSAMDRFMTCVLSILAREGTLIARVFPRARAQDAQVLVYFLERVANDVVSEYITTLLAAAQPLPHPLFLLATAATFGQVYRLVDCVLEIKVGEEGGGGGGGDEDPQPQSPQPLVSRERAEDVVFRMFEPLMDDYLAEEGEWIREVLEGICQEWDRKTAHDLAVSDPTFLASQNPAQVKRNVLAGFTKVLLLPVTIIPKTAEFGLNAITYGATGFIDTFASLGNQLSNVGGSGGGPPNNATATTKSQKSLVQAQPDDSTSSSASPPLALTDSALEPGDEEPRRALSTDEEEEEEETNAPTSAASAFTAVPIESSMAAWGGGGGGADDDDKAPRGGGLFQSATPAAHRLSIDASGHINLVGEEGREGAPEITARPVRGSTVPGAAAAVPGQFDRLQLLLSLDTALQLIQADRDSLKRIQTFIRYPGTYGLRVRDAIEEVFLVLLQVLSEKHVCPAFAQATQQMAAYKPSEHEDGVAVAPLVQFFELVHIGDTIQQMVDVYFEKEMAAFIDRRDFLNAVVREKKKFDSALDDAVAQGLNAAVNILMVSVEHLVTTRQGLRDFTPEREHDFDLTPTRACTEAIATLKHHCDMLRGSTDKQILEVFNQEIGIRLHGILLKHLKRQIVSTQGGLRLIADLNAYHAFVATLRQPQVTAYFTSLKMVGELFLIDDPKELGALVRDTSRYEGTLSQEDLYELVQRRADWQKIERLVDKAVYGLECLVC